MMNSKMIWREVVWQRPFELEDVHNVLTHLASLTSRSFIIWEVRCHEGRMRYLIGASPKSMSRVQEAFQSHGDISFLECEMHSRKPVSAAKTLKISKPVLTLNTDMVSSMIRATLAAMSGAKQTEETVVQCVLGRAYCPSSIPKDLPDPNANFIDIVLNRVQNASPEQRKSAKEKAEQHAFDCAIRIGISGGHTATRLNNIISAMRTLESAGVHIRAANEEPSNLNIATIPWRLPLRLSVRELAAFTLLPAGEEDLPSTQGLHPKQVLPPKWYKEPTSPTTDRTFAVSKNQPPKKLSISPKDSLEHMCVLGPTGSGKSTAMMRLILADINAGRSVLVIDPKQDLVTDILARIPESRADDVVVISPADVCPAGFNPLAFRQDPALTADTILATFSELWSANWGIRTADVLGASLNTLAQIPGATLLWLTPLLTDENFRRKIVSKIHDSIGLEPFWKHYEEMRDSERRTEIAPVLNKLRQITMRPGLRNVLGQAAPKFSLMELFTKRRIVLVPLNKGVVGAESARLLGSLIVGLTWSLALSRAEIPPEKRHIVSLYIDELQDYLSLPTSFSDALAQARGLGVAYNVAHQYRAQLPPEIKSAIDSNARNKIIFGLNSDDAKDMAAQAPELTALDFMTLPRYQIYTTFQSGGKSTGWISGQTLPPPGPVRMAADLHARSAQRYGCTPEAVERELLKIIQPEEPTPDPSVTDTPIGRRKRK